MVNPEEYYYAIGGGLLIAIAASFNLLMKGRISGISGILFGVITLNNILWRISFVLGMLVSYTYLYTLIRKEFLETPALFTQGLSFAGFIVTGYLVGFGTKLSNGCTSGHGVCGMPRLSIRSIVACGTFCIVGIAAATLKYNVPFLSEQNFVEVVQDISNSTYHYSFLGVLNFLAVLIPVVILVKKQYEVLYDYIISFVSGLIFGFGLVLSGMVKRQKVLNFLNVTSPDWDASLLIVLCAAVGFNLVSFYFIIKRKQKPLLAEKLELPTKTTIDWQLVVGAAIFGVGWGFGGLCPGPALVNIFMYIPHTLAWMTAFLIGQVSVYFLDKYVISAKPKPVES